MNWQLLVPLLVTTAVAMIGWWIGHWFATHRDRANKRRGLRINYLIEAYRRLERVSNAANPRNHVGDFEAAIADIQLFGSPRQVEMAVTFAKQFAMAGTASLDELLAELRDDLRKELGEQSGGPKLVFFRIVYDDPRAQHEEKSGGSGTGLSPSRRDDGL